MTNKLVLYSFALVACKGRSCLRVTSSSSIFCKQNSASVAWCVTYARPIVSMSKSESRRFQRVSLLVPSVRFSVRFKES